MTYMTTEYGSRLLIFRLSKKCSSDYLMEDDSNLAFGLKLFFNHIFALDQKFPRSNTDQEVHDVDKEDHSGSE